MLQSTAIANNDSTVTQPENMPSDNEFDVMQEEFEQIGTQLFDAINNIKHAGNWTTQRHQVTTSAGKIVKQVRLFEDSMKRFCENYQLPQ